LLDSLRGLLSNLGITTEQSYDETLTAARAELKGGSFVNNFYLAYGQRPR
jgi:hypothetical protein